MRMCLIGAATIALAASAAIADPGKGHGGGNGGNHGPAAASPAKGGGHGQGQAKQEKAGPARQAKADRGPSMQGGDGKAAKPQADRGPARKAAPAFAQGGGNGGGNGGKSHSDGKRADRTSVVREVGDVRDVRRPGGKADDRRVVRTFAGFDHDINHGLIRGCPPGLAKKNNGCQPPGLAKNRDDYRGDYYRPSWFGYSSAQDGRYRYGDGYLYRMDDRGSVLGYLPLLGGALSVGNPWPNYYQPAPVPDYYVQYYNLGQPNSYRYADDVLYRVDPQTDAITSIAALLTGDQFGIGQRMPAGYDVYNVPYAYRDQYYDTPQSDYRYADGYVYQVDPTTQLIQAAIQLLT